MTTIPNTPSLSINTLSGAITANQDLQNECSAFVSALVYAQDDYHSNAAGPLAVSLDIQDKNERPILTNLNTEVYVREDEAVGTTVHGLSVFDDGAATVSVLSTSPAAASGID